MDDAIGRGEHWSEEIGMVARVRCETKILQQQRRERVVFLEPLPMDGSVVVLSSEVEGVMQNNWNRFENSKDFKRCLNANFN